MVMLVEIQRRLQEIAVFFFADALHSNIPGPNHGMLCIGCVPLGATGKSATSTT
jgi:hypothetical protein